MENFSKVVILSPCSLKRKSAKIDTAGRRGKSREATSITEAPGRDTSTFNRQVVGSNPTSPWGNSSGVEQHVPFQLNFLGNAIHKQFSVTRMHLVPILILYKKD
ncbi:hypothetical protein DCC85_04065 [Paenibacillus sp. CAA11]|nr:hypothetical protein DCC85_04065 [Paenibacillus sp. CAA11]